MSFRRNIKTNIIAALTGGIFIVSMLGAFLGKWTLTDVSTFIPPCLAALGSAGFFLAGDAKKKGEGE